MTVSVSQCSYSRASRLDGPPEYAAVFAFRCWANSRLFRVYGKPNSRLVARLGVVVSKRVIAGAVDRNYYKRLVREVFRSEKVSLAGVDFVVRPHAVIYRRDSGKARVEISELLQRVRERCLSRVELLRIPTVASEK